MAPDSPIVLTILGMGTVFVVLAMIMFMIMIMGKILGSKPVPAVPAAPAAPTFNQEEEETVAVIMAAVTDCVGKDKIASINARPR